VLFRSLGFSQADTLLYENFDVDPTAAYGLVSNGNDTIWVDYDVDGLADGSGSSPARADNWWWNANAFSSVDLTGCLFSNSWFTSPGLAKNYLITPPIQIVDGNAVISWTSAPRQTPLFLDGYLVVVSKTNNAETSFTDTIFQAGEYLAGGPVAGDTTFSNFTFSNGFVHGEDGTYVEYDTAPDADSSRLVGQLRPQSVSLAAYAGQTIYIAFLHGSFDDNLIALDDICITGTLAGINNNIDADTKITVSPNPASDMVKVNYFLPGTAQVRANIFDAKGALVKSMEKGMQVTGNQQLDLNVSDLANGKYILQIVAGSKFTKTSFIVAR